jgi:GDPmannose 4,6-dehydratase
VPRALITGIGGQDGSYLAELLLEEGYEVAGTVLGSPDDYPTLEAVRERLRFVELELTDVDAVGNVASVLELDELYHLAAVSFVPAWWEDPVGLTRQTTTATVALLEGLRRGRPQARFFNACTSEIFAGAEEQPQRETTRPVPLTPYGAAKAFGLYAVESYRVQHGLHASSGILFNHESPRRPPHFVTRKITRAAAAISLGLEDHVTLGNLDARRDWGFAGDYVRAMWLMLQADEPDDYVIATCEAHTVRELADAAFRVVGLDSREYVRHDEALDRGATDARVLVGDATKARERLGWRPEVGFDELVSMMVQADLTLLSYDPARP